MKTLKLKNIQIAVLLLLICGAGKISAQRINEDLQPSASPKTVTSAPQAPAVKRKKTRNTRKVYKSTATTKTTPPINTTSSTPQPAPPTTAPVTNTNIVASVPAPPETPSQVLDRFINFQQSGTVNKKDWESVITQTNAFLQTNPTDPVVRAQSFIAQGQLAYNHGDYSTALIHFNAAAQALPESALPHYCIGQVYLVTKQPKEAQESFERALKFNKDFALAYKGMGEVMTALGKTKKAQEHFKKAAQVGLTGANGTTAAPATSGQNNQTADNNAAPAMPTNGYDVEFKNARVLTARKKWQDSLNKLMPLAENYKTAEVYIAIGDNYIGMRQTLSAQQAYRKATEIDGNSALAFFKLGQVLAEMNEHQAAYESFEKSIILDQQGRIINRVVARKLADRSKEKAEEQKNDKRKKILNVF